MPVPEPEEGVEEALNRPVRPELVEGQSP